MGRKKKNALAWEVNSLAWIPPLWCLACFLIIIWAKCNFIIFSTSIAIYLLAVTCSTYVSPWFHRTELHNTSTFCHPDNQSETQVYSLSKHACGCDSRIPLLSRIKNLDNVFTSCLEAHQLRADISTWNKFMKKGVKKNKDFQTWDWYLPHSWMLHLHNEVIV